VKWESIFQTGDVKVLLYLHEHKDVRHSELLKNVIKTRSVLSDSLTDLKRYKLIERLVDQNTAPIQTRYKLTDNGTKVVQSLIQIKKAMSI
jgi:DNA-binding HxlR family transcriptional regulator